ncbi:MAG: hypothetical protein ACKV2T_42925 [Kofleriaceae bacterium]
MRRALVLSLLVACGDDRPEIEELEPTSGSRLAIEQYQFDDGTRLVQPSAFYDRRIHARCTPQEWLDGVTRCVPDAEIAYYREDTCLTLFGVGNAIEHATHFLATDTRADGSQFWARAFEADGRFDEPIGTGYVKRGSSCTAVGIPQLETTTYWNLGGEIGGEDLVPITEREIGEGRLGLAVRASDDGALVPLGFRDHDLGVACSPTPSGTCEPTEVPTSDVFAENTCTQPAILVGTDEPAPPLAGKRGSDGCRVFHTVESTQATRAFRDSSGGCTPVATGQRVLPLGAPVELPQVTRTIGDAPKRRVQRITVPLSLASGDVQVVTTRVFDTATRSECELRQAGDTLALRCLPTALAPIVRLFQPGCVVERRLAEVPAAACEPFAFAMYDTGEMLEIHALGDPFDGTAYTIGSFGACTPYTARAGTSLFHVGPLLPADTFVGAVAFGAR